MRELQSGATRSLSELAFLNLAFLRYTQGCLSQLYILAHQTTAAYLATILHGDGIEVSSECTENI